VTGLEFALLLLALVVALAFSVLLVTRWEKQCLDAFALAPDHVVTPAHATAARQLAALGCLAFPIYKDTSGRSQAGGVVQPFLSSDRRVLAAVLSGRVLGIPYEWVYCYSVRKDGSVLHTRNNGMCCDVTDQSLPLLFLDGSAEDVYLRHHARLVACPVTPFDGTGHEAFFRLRRQAVERMVQTGNATADLKGQTWRYSWRGAFRVHRNAFRVKSDRAVAPRPTQRAAALPSRRLAVALAANDGQRRCPYCMDDVSADAHACDHCGTAHHLACFEEAGGCTIYGCSGRFTRDWLGGPEKVG
jgi:hypothetical protein